MNGVILHVIISVLQKQFAVLVFVVKELINTVLRGTGHWLNNVNGNATL